VEDIPGLFSLQAQAGDNRRYITSQTEILCGSSALACSMTNNANDPNGVNTGCRDNNVDFPYSCIINVVWDPSRITWYQGNGVPPSGSMDLWGVLVHEKGHWLGCNHSTITLESDNTATPTMRNASNGYAERTIQQDDINCARGARLPANRVISSNPGLQHVRSEWGGLNGTTWRTGGTGGTGPTTGTAWWASNYGANGTAGVQMISGSGAIGPINIHQVLSDLGSDPGRDAWHRTRPRKVNAGIYETGVSPFFANIIVTEGSAENSSVGPVLANIYCSFVWQGWTTCSTSWFTPTTGTYTAAVYNGSQQGGNVLAVDNLNVVLQ
jgi:hypothetical protein